MRPLLRALAWAGYAMGRAYSQSKLANLLFAYELQRRLSAAGAGLLSVAAHPGWAATEMEIRPPGERQRPLDELGHMLTRHLAATPAKGARRGLHRAGSTVRAAGPARPGPVQ